MAGNRKKVTKRKRIIRRIARAAGLVVLLLLAALWFWPIALSDLEPRRPQAISAQDYWESLQRADADPAIADVGRSIRLLPRGGSRDLVVMIHGLTNCPKQFEALAEKVSTETGAGVLVPRVPHHGLADRMNLESSKVSGEVLRGFAEDIGRVVAQARQDGGSVTVMGLSLGGTLTAWIAQHYPVDHAIVIAPVLGVPGYGRSMNRPMINFSRLNREDFWWWDDELKEHVPGPVYAYPRYSVFSVGEVLRMAIHLEREAKESAPQCRLITFVGNESDEAVSHSAIDSLKGLWGSHPGVEIASHTFPASPRLSHDLIDPNQVIVLEEGGTLPARPDLVYPVLVDMIRR